MSWCGQVVGLLMALDPQKFPRNFSKQPRATPIVMSTPYHSWGLPIAIYAFYLLGATWEGTEQLLPALSGMIVVGTEHHGADLMPTMRLLGFRHFHRQYRPMSTPKALQLRPWGSERSLTQNLPVLLHPCFWRLGRQYVAPQALSLVFSFDPRFYRCPKKETR